MQSPSGQEPVGYSQGSVPGTRNPLVVRRRSDGEAKKLRKKVEELTKVVQEQHVKIDQLQANVAELVSEAAVNNALLEEENATLRKKNEELTKRIEEHVAAVRGLQKEIEQLHYESVAEALANTALLQAENGVLQTSVADLSAELRDLQQELAFVTENTSVLVTENLDFLTTNQQLIRDLRNMDDRQRLLAQGASEEIEELKSRNAKLEEAVEAFEKIRILLSNEPDMYDPSQAEQRIAERVERAIASGLLYADYELNKSDEADADADSELNKSDEADADAEGAAGSNPFYIDPELYDPFRDPFRV